MTQRITQFGRPGAYYVFPAYQNSFRTNFGSAVPETQRFVGLNGGFDLFGVDPAPQEIGRITVAFTIVSTTREGMEAKRDELMKIRDWGVQRLYMQPSDPALSARWCYCRVNNISPPQQPDRQTDLWQPVTIDFQTSDPRWYTQNSAAATWGDGFVRWGDAANKWGGVPVNYSHSGTQTDFTITNNGSAITRPRFVFSLNATSGQNIRIQRLVNGVVEDEIRYAPTLAAFNFFEVDTRAWSFKINGTELYSTDWSFLHPDIFRLYPGANACRILTDNSTTGTLGASWFDAYY